MRLLMRAALHSTVVTLALPLGIGLSTSQFVAAGAWVFPASCVIVVRSNAMATGTPMDETALIRTYRSSVHALYEFVSCRSGGDRTLAEDVTQETWLRAVKAWRDGGVPDTPLAWLKTVARNLLSNHYRRLPMISLELLPPGWIGGLSENGDGWNEPDHATVLSWGLARLKPAEAHLLESFHMDGRSVQEIATEVGLSQRAVEGRLRRARLKLRKHLEPVVRSSREGGSLQ